MASSWQLAGRLQVRTQVAWAATVHTGSTQIRRRRWRKSICGSPGQNSVRHCRAPSNTGGNARAGFMRIGAMAVKDTASRPSKKPSGEEKARLTQCMPLARPLLGARLPRAQAAATCTGAYFLSIPLTASKTEAWTMAATALVTSGEVPDT